MLKNCLKAEMFDETEECFTVLYGKSPGYRGALAEAAL